MEPLFRRVHTDPPEQGLLTPLSCSARRGPGLMVSQRPSWKTSHSGAQWHLLLPSRGRPGAPVRRDGRVCTRWAAPTLGQSRQPRPLGLWVRSPAGTGTRLSSALGSAYTCVPSAAGRGFLAHLPLGFPGGRHRFPGPASSGDLGTRSDRQPPSIHSRSGFRVLPGRPPGRTHGRPGPEGESTAPGRWGRAERGCAPTRVCVSSLSLRLRTEEGTAPTPNSSPEPP